MVEYGVIVNDDSVFEWATKFGAKFTKRIRCHPSKSGDHGIWMKATPIWGIA